MVYEKQDLEMGIKWEKKWVITYTYINVIIMILTILFSAYFSFFHSIRKKYVFRGKRSSTFTQKRRNSFLKGCTCINMFGHGLKFIWLIWLHFLVVFYYSFYLYWSNSDNSEYTYYHMVFKGSQILYNYISFYHRRKNLIGHQDCKCVYRNKNNGNQK